MNSLPDPRPLTAVAAALRSCDECTLILDARDAPTRCPRCGSRLHTRKPASVQRTWALLLAAAIFYIPANVYPIMTFTLLGSGHPDTILSGIQSLFVSGQVPIALLVLFASILVPVLKLLGLGLLLISVQCRWSWRPRTRTSLYRLIESIGRWSMLDIFMLVVLVALVQVGSLATVEPGLGSLAFGAVVVLTMLAAKSFDPRLIWDALEEQP
jgi:paraquat-inducible protein A